MFSAVAVAFSSLVLAVIMVVGVAGNLVIVWIVKSSSRLKAKSHILIANLAVADTLQSCNIFFMLVTAINGGHWMFGETICQMTAFLTVEFVLASMLSITTISINRYFKVMHEKKYDKIFTAKSVWIIIAFIWTLPLMYAVPPLMGWSSYAFDPGKCFCLFRFRTNSSYAFFLAGTMTTPALVIMCYAYFRVFQAVKLHRNRVCSLQLHEERHKLGADEYKITSAVVVVVLSYIVCFVPATAVNFIEIFNSDYEIPLCIDFSSFVLIFVSHANNPLIYGFMSRQYRVSFQELLQRGSQPKRTRKKKDKSGDQGDLQLQKHVPTLIAASQALRKQNDNTVSCTKKCSTS
ncbi:melatonin receptor type 1B-B-like [Stylophora pistillata]|uniref:melatonin receptor type 1B-B-like n=1 Tax=Stylophora pistillata TaxID=50429 RepID=UPI000C04429A|nr:melatonin receptor type 1B-B-like [Stylophora pistillata]